MGKQLEFVFLTWEEKLDREFRRVQKKINWQINGQFIHGISPKYNVSPEWIEEHYNVDFGD